MKQKISTQKMALIALFCAFSYLCVFIFRIKVAFLTFDAKDAVMTIGGLLLGPVAGFFMALLTTLLEVITVSDTGFYGWLMNLISSATFVLPVSLLYRYRKNIVSALVGLFTSIALTTSLMMLANTLITPLYMGVSRGEVVALIPTLLLPFNLVKSTLNAGIVLVLYKPVSVALRRAGVHGVASEDNKSFRLTPVSVAVFALGLLLAAFAILYFTEKMGGKII